MSLLFGKLLIKGSQVTKDGSLVHKPDLKEAEFHFLEALRINPNSSISLFELGKLLSSKKMFYEAYQSFAKAIKIDSKFADAHYELAVLLMNTSAKKVISARSPARIKENQRNKSSLFVELPEPKKLLISAVKYNPAHLPSIVRLAEIYISNKEFLEATALLNDSENAGI